MNEKRPIHQFVGWLSGHPALLGAIVLLLTSSVGYVYERAFFNQFDINIFRFSSFYDFMYQWWRQWAVVSTFLKAILMIVSMIAGYMVAVVAVVVVDRCESVWAEKNELRSGERVLFGLERRRFRVIAMVALVVVLIVAVSFLVVRAFNGLTIGENVVLSAVMVFAYGVVVFLAAWLGQHLIFEQGERTPWRWTGLVLLLAGIVYLFSVMLMHVRDLALAESGMLKRDAKYTYTVYRSDGDTAKVISRDAKILAITTYYHLFYDRETSKVIAINNQYVGMLESNWLR